VGSTPEAPTKLPQKPEVAMIRLVKWLGCSNRILSIATLSLLLAPSIEAADFRVLSAQEPTIADIRAAFGSKDLTCRQLVQMYLDRIEAYDKKGPSLNAIVVVNPNVRSTMGLTSRDGIVPRQLHRGPLARSVADAVAVFDVLIAGSDAADPVTLSADGRRPSSYLASLDKNGLMGVRIGVLRQLLTGPNPEPDADPEIVKLFEAALADMKKQGAEIVEGIKIAEIDEIPASALGGCNRFKHDLKAYLARLGPGAPMKSLDDIVASQKFILR
jgi:Asp-tRNA(Asn)/Glu-tRNA(Gln) amidotransferase A subunit family amidase